MNDLYLTSLARIADFGERPYERAELPRAEWDTGDYVVAEILESGAFPFMIESIDGRAVEVLPGDKIVGALGRRAATLEVVGDWREVGDDLEMQTLTSAGVLGRCTSASLPPPPMADLRYSGHLMRGGVKATMRSFVAQDTDRAYEVPTVLIVGTSMSAGKTVAAKAIVRSLKRLGLKVAATKLTGVGRYRDVLAAGDAGADMIADFVDVGLPSTAVPVEEFEAALQLLLARLAAATPDVVVAEAGASPLEPYNGEVAVQAFGRSRCLHGSVRFRPVCRRRRDGGLRDRAGPDRRQGDQHRRRDRAGAKALRSAGLEHPRCQLTLAARRPAA